MTHTTSTETSIAAAAVALNTAGCWLLSPATKRRIAAEAGLTLPAGDYTLLTQLDRWQPVRLSTVAERLEVDRSSLSPQTRRLEQDGLIARLPDPHDNRAQLVEVTPRGRTVLGRLWEARAKALAALVEDWEPRDVERLTAGLVDLADSIGVKAHGEAAR